MSECHSPTDLEKIFCALRDLPADANTEQVQAVLSDDLALEVLTLTSDSLASIIGGYIVKHSEHFGVKVINAAAKIMCVDEGTPATIVTISVTGTLSDDIPPEMAAELKKLLDLFVPGAIIHLPR